MQANRAVVAAVVVVLVAMLGWWALQRSRSRQVIDLLETFDQAIKKPTASEFALVDATLAGETRKAIAAAAAPGTRLTWTVRVPDDGWLSVYLGLQPEAWEKEGNGVKFLVLVSDGKASEELFSLHVNPYGNPQDRKWIRVAADLSSYAGEQVDLIFNTYASPAGMEVDLSNDLPLWGSPEIAIR